MKTKYFKKDGKSYLAVTVPENISYGFISDTGKSFVFRCDGTYVKSNGEVSGRDGGMTTYISKKLPNPVIPIRLHRHYHKHDIVKFDFDDILLPAVIIQILNA